MYGGLADALQPYGFGALKAPRGRPIARLPLPWSPSVPISTDARKHVLILSARARQLRAQQTSEDWRQLREMVARLVARLISDGRDRHVIEDARPGTTPAKLVPLTESVAALRADGAAFLLECSEDWTPHGGAGRWRVPCDPVITMLDVDRGDAPLH